MKGLDILIKRGILNNKMRTVFAITSIIIAVTVMVSLNIATESVKTSLTKSIEDRALGADIVIRSGALNVTDDVIERLYRIESTENVYARIRIWGFYKNDTREDWVQILGIDFENEKKIDSYRLLSGALPKQDELLLTKKYADKIGAATGEKIEVRTENGMSSFKVAGIVENAGLAKENSGRVMLMNSDHVKAILNTESYSEANVGLKDRFDPISERETFQKTLGEGISVYLPSDKSENVIKSLNNLFVGFNIFAALAFFVGVFLINNTMRAIVLNSSREIAIMKVFGFVRKDIFRWIIGLSLFYGVVGSLVGFGLGVGLASAMIGLIESMVNTEAGMIVVPWLRVAFLSLIGILVSVAAGIGPAFKASNVSIIEGLSINSFRKGHITKKTWEIFGIVLLLLLMSALGTYYKAFRNIEYITFTLIIVTLYYFLFLITKPLVTLIYGIGEHFAPLNSKINHINLTTNVTRTANTVFAIIICISMSVGLSGVLTSFKQSMLDQFKTIYSGDILVNAAFGLKEKDIELIKNSNKVSTVAPIYSKFVISDKKDINVFGIDLSASQLKFSGNKESYIVGALNGEKAIVISKTMAYKWKKGINDYINIPTDYGNERFRIVGFTKTPDQNAMEAYMSSKNFIHLYPKTYAEKYLLTVPQNIDKDELIKQLESAINDEQVTYERIDEYIQDIKNSLDMSFSVFYVLIFIVYIVGGLVIVNSINMNIREMKYQLSLLKVFGLKKMQMFFLMLDMGFIYGLLGTTLGSLLGFFINYSLAWLAKDMMGLELQVVTNLKEVAGIVIIGIIIALISAISPALRGYKVNVVNTLRKGESFI